MIGKIKPDLGSVQKTLLLPLWGRAVETQKTNPKLVDPTAYDIINKIDYDFSPLTVNLSYITQLAWIARSIHIDNSIKKFLSVHPEATIVNIGAGLDTTYERVNNGILTWYDLDLPDVICLRKKFMCETENRKFISASLLDDKWINEIKINEALLITAAGVLYYLSEKEVQNFFNILLAIQSGHVPSMHGEFIHEFRDDLDIELVFDAVTPLGLRTANEKVIKGGGMDEGALLKWGIKSSAVLQGWNSRIRIINEYPLFKGVRRGMSLKEKCGTFLSDMLKIMFIVHLKFL